MHQLVLPPPPQPPPHQMLLSHDWSWLRRTGQLLSPTRPTMCGQTSTHALLTRRPTAVERRRTPTCLTLLIIIDVLPYLLYTYTYTYTYILYTHFIYLIVFLLFVARGSLFLPHRSKNGSPAFSARCSFLTEVRTAARFSQLRLFLFLQMPRLQMTCCFRVLTTASHISCKQRRIVAYSYPSSPPSVQHDTHIRRLS